MNLRFFITFLIAFLHNVHAEPPDTELCNDEDYRKWDMDRMESAERNRYDRKCLPECYPIGAMYDYDGKWDCEGNHLVKWVHVLFVGLIALWMTPLVAAREETAKRVTLGDNGAKPKRLRAFPMPAGWLLILFIASNVWFYMYAIAMAMWMFSLGTSIDHIAAIFIMMWCGMFTMMMMGYNTHVAAVNMRMENDDSREMTKQEILNAHPLPTTGNSVWDSIVFCAAFAAVGKLNAETESMTKDYRWKISDMLFFMLVVLGLELIFLMILSKRLQAANKELASSCRDDEGGQYPNVNAALRHAMSRSGFQVRPEPPPPVINQNINVTVVNVQGGTQYCSQCGAEIQQNAIFCNQCGAPRVAVGNQQ